MIILNVIQHKSLHTSYLHQFFCRKVESYHSAQLPRERLISGSIQIPTTHQKRDFFSIFDLGPDHVQEIWKYS